MNATAARGKRKPIFRVHISRNAYAFFLLTLVSLLLDIGVILIGLAAISANDHKFCDVVHAATANPITRPADPKKAPAQEQQWEWYQRYVALDRSLGC